MATSVNTDPPTLQEEYRDKKLKYSRWMLIPVLFCYVFGGGMNLYTVPEYIQLTIKHRYQYNHSAYNTSHPSAGDQKSINDHVQQESAKWNVYLALATYIPAIFTNIILGSYSDAIGRKVLLVINLCGTLIRTTFAMLIIKIELDLYFFVFGSLIDGLTGSFTTLLAVSFSYVSDLTKAGNQRTLFIVLLELLLSLAITTSAFTVGYFIKLTGFFYPAMTGTVISFLAVVMAAVALPETLVRNRYSMDSDNPTATTSGSRLLQTVKNIWTLYFGQNEKITSVKYLLLLLAFMFTCLAQFGNMDTLYQLGSPFYWSATRIGWYAALKTGLSSTLGLFSAFLLKRVMGDDGVAAIGTTSLILGQVFEAVSTTSAMLYFVPAISFLSSLPTPMIRSLMSHMTSSDMQGALFASIGSIETICVLLGSLTTNIVYAATLSIMNGFVFLVIALYAFIALVLIISFMAVKRCGPDEPILLLEVDVDNENDDISVDLNIPD